MYECLEFVSFSTLLMKVCQNYTKYYYYSSNIRFSSNVHVRQLEVESGPNPLCTTCGGVSLVLASVENLYSLTRIIKTLLFMPF